MTLDQIGGGFRPASAQLPSIQDVLDAHGARRVLAAAIAALLRGRQRKTRPPDITLLRLNSHLRRDIGLPPRVEERRIIRL